MKVEIKYTEIQVFENTIEVEMTSKEYKDFLKKSIFEQEQQFDFCAKTSVEHHVSTETYAIETIINDTQLQKSIKEAREFAQFLIKNK